MASPTTNLLQTESSVQQTEKEGTDDKSSNATASELLSTSRRRKCKNRHGNRFDCAARDNCCGNVCVGRGGSCCRNVNGDDFPCGEGGGCCGNACFAAGSKCCISFVHGKERWYPVTKATKCASGFFGTTNRMASPTTNLLQTESSVEQTDEEADEKSSNATASELLSTSRRRKCKNRHGNRFD